MNARDETTTYRGACHCGAVRFTFRSEPVTRGLVCNCSICTRKGAVMTTRYIPRADFDELVGFEALTIYRWGDRMVNHYFCGRCGIHPFHDATTQPEHFRVNLRCVEDLDLSSLAIERCDGRSF